MVAFVMTSIQEIHAIIAIAVEASIYVGLPLVSVFLLALSLTRPRD
jgi:hypothetical protein